MESRGEVLVLTADLLLAIINETPLNINEKIAVLNLVIGKLLINDDAEREDKINFVKEVFKGCSKMICEKLEEVANAS